MPRKIEPLVPATKKSNAKPIMPKPYRFIRFGDFHGPKACKFMGFGDVHEQIERKACYSEPTTPTGVAAPPVWLEPVA